MGDGQTFWMLALMPPRGYLGTFFYADKFPGETRKLQAIQCRVLNNQTLQDAQNIVGKQFVSRIARQAIGNTGAFYPCIENSSGFEEKMFIQKVLYQLELSLLAPRGSSLDWSRRNNIGREGTSSGGSSMPMSTSSGHSRPAKRARSSTPGCERSTASSARPGPSSASAAKTPPS